MTLKQTNYITLYILVFCVLFLFLPFLTYAEQEGFIALTGAPGIENATQFDMQTYINTMLKVAIIAAALIAVVKLILAGAQYILDGVITHKEKAKKDIKAALVGLLIVLSAVTILQTINPNIVNLPTLKSASDFYHNVPLVPHSDALTKGGTQVLSTTSAFTVDEARDIIATKAKECATDGGTFVLSSTAQRKMQCVDNLITSKEEFNEELNRIKENGISEGKVCSVALAHLFELSRVMSDNCAQLGKKFRVAQREKLDGPVGFKTCYINTCE